MLLSENERIMCKRKELINKTKQNTAKAKTKEKAKAIKDRMMESRKVQI